ncbi:MAG: MGDG synthase family glycosyltransferase, partial [Streptomyces sp.]|uniref:MGDG synthase family glycosyltransferase n=1 Tax=Streptomyces sp. TaxID=1931 RepID=UPI003D6AB7E2
MRQRFLLLSASMGAGHDAVAGELAGRLRARGHKVLIQDVLALLPPGVGPMLRGGYRGAIRHAPQLYGAVYAAFLSPGTGTVPRPGSAPMAALAQGPLLRLVDRWHPDAVVSTFHLSAQLTGRLRERGALRVPGVVAVIDFAVHRGWLHPGNDLHLCVTETAASAVRAATGKPAEVTGPVVPGRFHAAGESPGSGETDRAWRDEFDRRAPGRPAVLLSAGAWGVASELAGTARRLV